MNNNKLPDFIKKYSDLILPAVVILFVFGKNLSFFIPLLIIFFAYKYFQSKFKLNPQNFMNKEKIYDAAAVSSAGAGKLFKWLFFAGIVFIFFLFIGRFFVIIQAGQTGVYTIFGKVKEYELQSGFHFINPFAEIYRISTRTESYTMSQQYNEGQKKGDDSINALTKEGLNVNLEITTLYHVQEDKASEIYENLGPDFEEKLIRPEIRSAIREIIARYEAKDIYSEKRNEAAKEIFAQLSNKINERGIIVEDVLLRNVILPNNLAQAIQEKLQAEQESQKYDFVLQKEKKEAERKIIEAEGQRDAQKIINESLSENYLNYLYIKELKDRQGTIYVPVSPSSGMPMFFNAK